MPVNPGVVKARLDTCHKCDLIKSGRCTSNHKIVVDFATFAKHCPEYRWPQDPSRPPKVSSSSSESDEAQKPSALKGDRWWEKEAAPEVPKPVTITSADSEILANDHELLKEPIPRDLLKEAEPAEIGKIAIITSYFNSEGYQNIRDNYRQFREHMAHFDVDLFVVELAFDDDEFEIEDAALQIRGSRKEHKLFQKECLLNLLIDKVPDEYDAIGWFDCDIIFQNKHWVEGVRETLGRYTWCQPFASSFFTESMGRLTSLKSSVGWYLHHDPANFLNFGKSHPGFAWVARSEWIRKYKLCFSNVTGGGDGLMVKAITEQPLFIERWLNPEWIDDVSIWSSQARADGGRHFGYVDGDIIHLFHGTRANRKYRQRWCYLTDYDFNPRSDIEVDPENGLLRWTESAWNHKPEMIARVANYFGERAEDEFRTRLGE